MPTSVLASIALHVAVILFVLLFGALHGAAASTGDLTLEFQIEEPPPPPAPPVETAAPAPVSPVTPAPRVAPKPPPEPVVESRPAPPLPELPPAAVEHPSPTPPKRVVGIEMESTTTAGTGDGWVVGNTPMGKTSGVAEDPNAGGGGGPSFVPPRRASAPQPDYPAALKARSVEGDVGLEVQIDASGRVSAVSVVSSSGHPEFDRSAVDAAWRSTYEPARRNGWPVAHAIEFTVRFRLHP